MKALVLILKGIMNVYTTFHGSQHTACFQSEPKWTDSSTAKRKKKKKAQLHEVDLWHCEAQMCLVNETHLNIPFSHSI